MIVNTLKTAVGFCGPNLGFESKDASTRSLRVSGSMDLLCLVVDSTIIHLVGCWRSNEILRYLHIQAEPLMRNFSRLMFSHGNNYFMPHQEEVPYF